MKLHVTGATGYLGSELVRLRPDATTERGEVRDADAVSELLGRLRPDVIISLRYGDYSAIKRRYLPDDYCKDAAGHAVCETVYVETEWDPNTPLDETRYAAGLGARWLSPVGPLRIELGKALNAKPGDEKSLVLFSFGGPFQY